MPLSRRLSLGLGLALTVALLGPGTAFAQGLFFPLDPCRLVETRQPSFAPALAANSTRSFTIQGSCGIRPAPRPSSSR